MREVGKFPQEAPSTTGTALYLDPSLGASAGHHRPLARGFAVLAGRPITFAGACQGRFACPSEGGRFAPVFSYRLEDAFRVSRSGAAWQGHGLGRWIARGASRFGVKLAGRRSESYALLFRGLKAGAALEALLREAPADVVSMGADPATLAALHAAGAVFAAPGGPRLHIAFMYPERDFLPNGAEGYFGLVRDMLSWGRPPCLYAELAEHAVDLSAALGAPVAHQILPYRWPAASPPRPAGPFTVAVLGAGRADKGFDGLPEAVAATAALDPGIAFRIQEPQMMAGLGRAARALARMRGVTLLPAQLTEAAYESELARAHVVLIAYDAERYARRGSGVFIDALLFGRPIVCVADTALARALRGNGLSARGPEGVAGALSEARRCYDALFAAAARERENTAAAIRNGPLFTALRMGEGA